MAFRIRGRLPFRAPGGGDVLASRNAEHCVLTRAGVPWYISLHRHNRVRVQVPLL